MSIEQKVRDYIFANILFAADPASLQNDDSFLDKGIIDSTGILELIFFLEQNFQIKIHDEELMPENLDSVNKIGRFVERKLAQGAVS